MRGIEWRVEFEEGDKSYIWSGQFDASTDATDSIETFEPVYTIIRESLVRSDSEIAIVSRDSEELLYHDIPTVRLDPSKSAVELLKEQPDIAPVRAGLKRITWLKMDTTGYTIFPASILDPDTTSRTFEDIRRSRTTRQPIDTLFLIQRYVPKVFQEIKDTFIEVFPLVEDIDYDVRVPLKKRVFPILKIKEKGVDTWIEQPNISAGMCRTLSQIVALRLADDGDVILIDEFENGLGINCIDQLAEMALEPDSNVQIIMTSHHPYIINTIPFRAWRIVTREGSDVSVSTAGELRIGERSRHDAFMQLIQTQAYRTGRS